jgi:hypothetical protein
LNSPQRLSAQPALPEGRLHQSARGKTATLHQVDAPETETAPRRDRARRKWVLVGVRVASAARRAINLGKWALIEQLEDVEGVPDDTHDLRGGCLGQ